MFGANLSDRVVAPTKKDETEDKAAEEKTDESDKREEGEAKTAKKKEEERIALVEVRSVRL